MRSVAIISKPQKPELATILPELTVWLKQHGYSALLDPMSASYLGSADVLPRHLMHERRPELVIVLGGDGTLLAAARAFARTQTPILSVNRGSLGFLAEVPREELFTTLESWRQNGCTIDELGFQRRTEVEQVFRQLRKRFGVVVAGVLDDAFANFEGEI